MKIIKKSVSYTTKKVIFGSKGEFVGINDVVKTIEFELGELAKQANASVKVSSGGTSVLCCVVSSKKEKIELDSEGVVPLTVNYRERTYAAGKIPGGFFKREGRPREHEIHISRLIDRSLRPLFPKDIDRDVQIDVLVLSFDPENDPGILAVLGSSVALMVSDIPFNGPCSCLRCCRIKQDYVINPSFQEREISDIDVVVSFYKDKILMIEFEGDVIKEKEICNSIEYLQNFVVPFHNLQEELITIFGKEKFFLSKKYDFDKLVEENYNNLKPKILDLLKICSKRERANEYDKLVEYVTISEKYVSSEICNNSDHIQKLKEKVMFNIFRDVVRKEILRTKIRPDGRKPDELREISCKIDVLERAHGSALFQRGETQALVTVTLGTSSDMQVMDELIGEYKERFLFHYNFPGFATGEIRPDRGVSRRELGHGFLAKKSLQAVLPSEEDFPYTIRVVSDILESNGSSSMASVCGGSLALFNAGVKLKTAVAGVAIGLICDEDEYMLLTDIAGIEDHTGDMDFKIAGTKDGVTAIQLDLKIPGIPIKYVSEALECGKKARMEILEIMNSVIPEPREKISSLAPKIKIIQIPQNKIGDLIGPGGKNIRQIIEETQTKIDIDPNGKVFISAESEDTLNSAVEKVQYFTQDIEVDKIYKGKIIKIVDYGAFVEVLPNKVGLLHISKISDGRIRDINSIFKEGDEIYVKVIEIDSEGRPVLSRKHAIREGYK